MVQSQSGTEKNEHMTKKKWSETVGYFHKSGIENRKNNSERSHHAIYSGFNTKNANMTIFSSLAFQMFLFGKKTPFLTITPLQKQMIISTIHFAYDDLYAFAWPDNATNIQKELQKVSSPFNLKIERTF